MKKKDITNLIMHLCTHCALFVNYKYMFTGTIKSCKIFMVSSTCKKQHLEWNSMVQYCIIKKSFLRVYCICTGTEDTNPRRGMLITLELCFTNKSTAELSDKDKSHLLCGGRLLVYRSSLPSGWMVQLCSPCGNYCHYPGTQKLKRRFGNVQTTALLSALTHKRGLHRMFFHSVLVVSTHVSDSHHWPMCCFFMH